MRDFLLIGLAVVGIAIFFTALTFGPALYFSSASCGELEQKTGQNTEWTFNQGCYIEVDGKMIPKTNWRVNNEG